MKKKIFFGTLSFLFLLYLAAGFWLLPSYATKKVGPELGLLLGTKVKSGEIRFNPITFELTVPDFVVYQKDGTPLLKLKAFYLNFSPVESLIHLAPTLQELRLKHPEIFLSLDKNGTFNFAPILKHLEQTSKKPAETGKKSEKMPKVRLGQFAVESATVTFEDRSAPKPARFVATNFNFGIENLSTLPEEYGFSAYEIETEEGTRVRSFAKIALDPLLVRGYLDIRRLDLTRYDPYLAKVGRLSCKRGLADLFVRFEISQKPGGLAAALRQGRVKASGVRVDDALGTPLKMGTFAVSGLEARWPQRSVRVKKISLETGSLYIAQNAKGEFSFQKWTQKSATPPKSAPSAQSDPANPWHVTVDRIEASHVHTRFETPLYLFDTDHNHRIDALRLDTAGKLETNLTKLTLSSLLLTDKKRGTKPFKMKTAVLENGELDLGAKALHIGRIALEGADILACRDQKGMLNLQRLFIPSHRPESARETKSENPETPFLIALKRFEVTGAKVAFDDRFIAHSAKLTARKIHLGIDDLRYPQKKSAPFTLSLQMPGGGKTTAKGTFLSKPFKADIRLAIVDTPLRPYVPFLQEFVHLDIPKGDLSTRARIRYDARKKPEAIINYEISLNDLQLDHALKKETIFSVQTIEVAPARLQLMPNNMKIEKIVLKAPYARVHIAKDHSTNLDDLLVERNDTARQSDLERGGKKKNDFGFFLTRLAIEKGRSDFSDLSLPLPFRTHIHDLEGEALGISNEAEDVASIRLKGIVDKYGMATIKALLLPADPLEKSEITLDFRNLDVTNLSPYTGKYIGYAIKDGRLWMNLRYEIDMGRLVSDNRIVLKKLELGEKIESNESIDAPVQLALALLKDSNGVINLDIPVEGNVTDPTFRIGKVVWQTLGNMITGIVAAPFRFLGSMLGLKGEELQYVDFEPGDATITPTELEKLDKIVQVFIKRPLLKLELNGTYHEKADTRGLRVRKMREILVKKAKLTNVEEVNRAMNRQLLETLYKERAGSEAFLAFKKTYFKTVKTKGEKPDKRDYLKKLYEALLKTVPVEKNELVALGNTRARHVAEHLKRAGLSTSRIGIRPPMPAAKLSETGMVPLKLGLDTVKESPK